MYKTNVRNLNEFVRIDIEKIIESKNPKLRKILPKFIINFLKRVIHQEDINLLLEKYKDFKNYDFIRAILKEFNIKYEYYGLENIDRNKRYIFSANHPQGGLESLALMKIVKENFGECKFIVNDILLNLRNLKELFIPVSIFGKQTKDSLQKIKDAFNSEIQILYYPAGLVSRKIKGKIKDLPWKKTFIKLAKEYKRDIIPVFIEASNSNFFYIFCKIRKMLGIKLNIEMILLPSEMFKNKNTIIKFFFGTPYPYTFFENKYSDEYWANYMYNVVYSLKEKFKKI